jgi:hypothetical protein
MRIVFLAAALIAACAPNQDGPTACAEDYDAGREAQPYTLCTVGIDPSTSPLVHGAYCYQRVVTGTTRLDCYTEIGASNGVGRQIGLCTQPCGENEPCVAQGPTNLAFCLSTEHLCVSSCPGDGLPCPAGLRCETRATNVGDRRVCVPETCSH